MALAPRLSSGSAIESVAARPDALEVGPCSAGARRKAAIDRIPRDGISEEPFDRGVGLPHAHRGDQPAPKASMTAVWITPLPARRVFGASGTGRPCPT